MVRVLPALRTGSQAGLREAKMTVDQTMPEGKWNFDDAVAEAFDDMLERSVPAYNTMRELTTSLAREFITPTDDVLDLGCSRGQALVPLVRGRSATARRYVGIDVSEPMLAAARREFATEIEEGFVEIRRHDLRERYPNDVSPSVTLAVLTLQFTPIEHRQRIVQDAYNATVPGGALLLVEKVLGAGSHLHDVFDREYLRMKSRNGYTDEQIARKKASLEGVLVSMSASMNEALLRSSGFRHVDCYWRWLNFAGWVAVR